jgi:predicted NBD/HSP70 family sugar kinase
MRSAWPDLAPAERAALLEVLIHGSLPRAEIARRLGLSRATLTRITRTLVEAGLLTEGATELRATTGRPSEMLQLRTDTRRFLGVKLTGDTLYAVVTDLGARILSSIEEPLVTTEVDDVVDQIAAVAARMEVEHPGLTAIGVCLAGDVANRGGEGIVTVSPFLGWRDVPLGVLLQQRTGHPSAAQNDVLALTAAEHWFGAGAGLDSMALLTVGIGLGFGLVVHGQVVTGAHGRPGRLSHVIIDSGGPICKRGHRGCASTYLVNDAIVTALGGPPLDYEGALRRAREGDPAARRAFEDAGVALGALIALVVNTIDPEKVILSGDGLAIYELAADRVHQAMDEALDTGSTVNLDVQPFDFSEWARAGAVLAIRSVLS